MKLKELIGKENISKEDIEGFETDDPLVARTANVALQLIDQGYTLDSIIEEVEEQFDYYTARYNYKYNPDFDPRSIVGDNYDDPNDRNYGNNDVKGPDAFHGTGVAGAIAANRNDGTDVKGVANNVRIMGVRVVPDGDERDKDVANAIRYAVDNGASVINMSFGKGYSWDKKAVDKAVKYAAKKDVLLVHGAGNDGKENFPTNNFPNDQYEKNGFLGLGKKSPDNWIEVGALSWETGENMAASFSNYSQENVDVFAPGVRMKLPVQDDEYKTMDGTSFAAPVVAGVAAMLRSYFPGLTAAQVKEIIMESAIRPKGTVLKPGSEELVPFEELSVSGGMVNVFNAMIKANEIQGKKKSKAVKEKSIP
ncbi:MAG: S8 family serine peptidase [Saprospiraceae bacterium]|nr:S8 family serine peptidase [Saprospiraceae bacterium]